MRNYVFLQKPYYSIFFVMFSHHCGFFEGNWDLFCLWKPLLHWLQWYGFSPVWILWCLIMTGCINIVYHEWLFWWTLRCLLGAKNLVKFAAIIWAHCWRNMLVHTMLAYDNSMLTEFYCVLNYHTSLEKHCYKYCIVMI